MGVLHVLDGLEGGSGGDSSSGGRWPLAASCLLPLTASATVTTAPLLCGSVLAAAGRNTCCLHGHSVKNILSSSY